jgi:hypothetical protein
VVRSLRELLRNFLKLLADYRSVEAIDVKPIAFFAFDRNLLAAGASMVTKAA